MPGRGVSKRLREGGRCFDGCPCTTAQGLLTWSRRRLDAPPAELLAQDEHADVHALVYFAADLATARGAEAAGSMLAGGRAGDSCCAVSCVPCRRYRCACC